MSKYGPSPKSSAPAFRNNAGKGKGKGALNHYLGARTGASARGMNYRI